MVKPSITFVSHNRLLAGQELTITLGDRVKFHPSGRPNTYLARVIRIEEQRVRVSIERSFSGGNTSMHRWRNGHRVSVPVDEIHELVPRGST